MDVFQVYEEGRKETVLKVTKLPELPEIWVNPDYPVFNQKKHNETCAKNRKKRKKRKRM